MHVNPRVLIASKWWVERMLEVVQNTLVGEQLESVLLFFLRRTLSNCLSKIVSMKRLFFEPFELKIYFFEIYNPNFGVHVTI